MSGGHGLEGAFLTLCNPLLDISAVVDQAFLDKYQVWCLTSELLGARRHLGRHRALFGWLLIERANPMPLLFVWCADQAGQPDPG